MPDDQLKLQTLELIKQYQKCTDLNHKRRLSDRITRLNIGLVQKVANQVVKGFNHGVDVDDLIQEGCKGLLKAIDKFDVASGNAFSSFAVPKIRGEMQHFVRDKSDLIRIPRRWENVKVQIRKMREKGWTGRAIANHLGWTEAELAECEGATQRKAHVDISSDRMIEFADSHLAWESNLFNLIYIKDIIVRHTNAVLDEDGFFCATDVCLQHNKEFSNFWRLKYVKDRVAFLENLHSMQVFRIKSGRGGKAWLHYIIAPEFLIWVNREKFYPLIMSTIVGNMEELKRVGAEF